MKYDFDSVIDRRGTNSVKYDLTGTLFGRDDVLPMWVADMDFPVAGFILDSIRERLKHPFLGYTFRSDSFAESVTAWLDRRKRVKSRGGQEDTRRTPVAREMAPKD